MAYSKFIYLDTEYLESKKIPYPEFRFILIWFLAVFGGITALQGGQPEPAFPVRKTGVGDLRGHGVTLVIDIDDSSESGCRVPGMCPPSLEQPLASPYVLCVYVRTIWGRHCEICSKFRDRGTRDIPRTDRCRAWSTCSWSLYPDGSHIFPFFSFQQ